MGDTGGGLGRWSVMWTEYYGASVARCSDLPCSRVVFGTPTATGAAVAPERSHSHLGDLAGPGLDHQTCDTSRIEAVAGGVRHEMAGPVSD